MANRAYRPFEGSLDPKVVHIHATLTTGASGAVSTGTGKGVASFVRNSAGKYTITLQDRYYRFFQVQTVIQTSDGLVANTKGRTFNLVGAPSGNTVVVQADTGAGVAADVPDNAVVRFTITAGLSSV